MIHFSRILCPTDFSEASLEAFPYAIELARVFKAEILFIYVVPVLPPPPADFGFENEFIEFDSALRRDAEGRMNKLVSAQVPADIKFRLVLAQGDAAEEILRAADENHIELITIATHGVTGWRHLIFGSVAEKVVRLAKIPVLTVGCHDRSLGQR
jgi:nucleotide-binding universal stress UspA family protein